MLMIHNKKCETHDNTTIKTSSDSHLHWKKHFLKDPLYFRIYADFKADNAIDKSDIVNKTTSTYKQNQNPVLNGYQKESEMQDVLQNSYFKSPLGYENVDWFVDEVIKSESKMTFKFLKTLRKMLL